MLWKLKFGIPKMFHKFFLFCLNVMGFKRIKLRTQRMYIPFICLTLIIWNSYDNSCLLFLASYFRINIFLSVQSSKSRIVAPARWHRPLDLLSAFGRSAHLHLLPLELLIRCAGVALSRAILGYICAWTSMYIYIYCISCLRGMLLFI